TPVGAASDFDVKNQSYTNKFPDGIEFMLQANSVEPVRSATVQYTVDSGNGVVGTYGRPDSFTPSTDLDVTFFHNNKKSYLPPGTRVTFHWEVEDAKGNKFKTDEVKFTQDDPRFQWKSITKNDVMAYWYAGDQAFGQSIVDATLEAID